MAENRVDNHMVPFTTTRKQYLKRTGSLVSAETFTGECEQTFVRSPVQKRKKDDGGFRMPTPYYAAWESCEPLYVVEEPIAETSTYRYVFTGTGFTTLPGYWRPPSGREYNQISYPSHLTPKGINGALQKLKGQNANYLLIAAEADRSVELVAATAKRITRALRAAKKGRLKDAARALCVSSRPVNDRRAARHLDELSGYWLELQYGWKPLLSDVESVLKDTHDLLSREFPVSARYAPSLAIRKEWEVGGFTGRPNGSYWKGVETANYKFQTVVRLDATLDLPALRAMARVGLTDVASVAWEMVPWSFIWDWWNPVGEYLDALNAAMGLTFKAGSITEYENVEVRRKFEFDEDAPLVTASGKIADKFVKGQMNRRILNDFPSAQLYIKNPWSTAHAQNALALMWSVAQPNRSAVQRRMSR